MIRERGNNRWLLNHRLEAVDERNRCCESDRKVLISYCITKEYSKTI